MHLPLLTVFYVCQRVSFTIILFVGFLNSLLSYSFVSVNCLCTSPAYHTSMYMSTPPTSHTSMHMSTPPTSHTFMHISTASTSHTFMHISTAYTSHTFMHISTASTSQTSLHTSIHTFMHTFTHAFMHTFMPLLCTRSAYHTSVRILDTWLILSTIFIKLHLFSPVALFLCAVLTLIDT
jgi:hypothetical protein